MTAAMVKVIAGILFVLLSIFVVRVGYVMRTDGPQHDAKKLEAFTRMQQTSAWVSEAKFVPYENKPGGAWNLRLRFVPPNGSVANPHASSSIERQLSLPQEQEFHLNKKVAKYASSSSIAVYVDPQDRKQLIVEEDYLRETDPANRTNTASVGLGILVMGTAFALIGSTLIGSGFWELRKKSVSDTTKHS